MDPANPPKVSEVLWREVEIGNVPVPKTDP